MATATGSKEGKRGSKEGKHREITKIIISRRMGRFRKQLRVFWKALSVLDVMRTALGRGSRFGIPMKIKENQRGRIVTPYLCTPRARVSRAHVVFARGGVFARAAGCLRARRGVRARGGGVRARGGGGAAAGLCR